MWTTICTAASADAKPDLFLEGNEFLAEVGDGGNFGKLVGDAIVVAVVVQQ